MCLTYFDQRLGNGTSWLNSRNLTVGQARTRRREKLVKSEKETTKLSALWPVLCILIKVLRYERKRVKNNSFFVDVMIEKNCAQCKKGQRVEEENNNRGLMFLLQRVTTLFNTAPTAVAACSACGSVRHH